MSETRPDQVVIRRASRIQATLMSQELGGPQPPCHMELSFNATVGQLVAQCVGTCPSGTSCQLVEDPPGSGNWVCSCLP